MRVAIIGSGPAGFYAAEALLRRTDTVVHVDMFDRLPTPYGLVGNGNTAIDAARFLLRTPAELEKTDVAAHALEALRHSQVREVFTS